MTSCLRFSLPGDHQVDGLCNMRMLRESTTVDEECSICVKPISTASGSGASGLWSGPPQAGCKKYFSPTSFVNGLCTNKFFNVAAPDDCDTICVTPIDNVTGLPSSGSGASGSLPPAGSRAPCLTGRYLCRDGNYPLEFELNVPYMPGGTFPCRASYYGTFYLQRINAECGYAKYDSIEKAKSLSGSTCTDYPLFPRFRLIMSGAGSTGWVYSLEFLYVADPFVVYPLGKYSVGGIGNPPTCLEPIELTYITGTGSPGFFTPPGVITLTPILGGF